MKRGVRSAYLCSGGSVAWGDPRYCAQLLTNPQIFTKMFHNNINWSRDTLNIRVNISSLGQTSRRATVQATRAVTALRVGSTAYSIAAVR